MDENEIGINSRSTMEVESVYDEEKLDLDSIRKNPILKPISEINNSFQNFELLINRALWDYQQDKTAIDGMIEANPKYSETMIMAKVQSILGHIKQIIHAQDIQKENMKSVIRDMIKITREEYAPLQEPEPPTKPKKKLVKDKKDNEKVEKEEVEKEKTFHSDLLDKEINLSKEDKFIPIKNKLKQ